MPSPPFRFALPPSTGLEGFSEVGVQLRQALERAVGGPADVTVSQTYEVLTRNLLSGAIDAAWAPPFVCAKTEPEGGRVLVQTQRRGVTRYASALLVRQGSGLRPSGLKGKQVAWVDPWSVAGYLLPVAHLQKRFGPVDALFGRQGFAGSYGAALEALKEGQVDVAAVHSLPDDPQAWRDAVEVHLPGSRDAFTLLDATDAVPSDGVVLGPRFVARGGDAAAAALTRVLVALPEAAGGAALLKALFRAEAFVPAPPGAYRALYHIAPR
jgi:phosphonate transport system substrate-binding protein